jgi:LDH2 family malate/lactate/ureidoglycolate dehydrogenase
MTLVDHRRLGRLYGGIARAHGAGDDEAEVFSDCLLRADLRGYTRQGAALIPYYDELLRGGRMRFGVAPRVVGDGPAFAILDGRNGVGQVVARRAAELASTKADAVGVGLVAVRDSGDFAMAAAHALQMLGSGHLGLAMSTGQALVAPWGGREPFFCTNPIAVAVPTGSDAPVVFDAASSAFSMGRLVRAARDGEVMDRPAVVDPEGRYSADPATIVEDPSDRESKLNGAILPDGPKGYGWLLVVEVLGAVLSGMYADSEPGRPAGRGQGDPRFGQCFIAIDVERILGPGAFRRDMDRLVAALEQALPAAGHDAVRVPGARAAAEERRRRADGVPVREEEWRQLLAVCERLGVADGEVVQAP